MKSISNDTGIFGKLHKYYFNIYFAFLCWGLCFIVPAVMKKSTMYYPVIGGVVGAVSSLIVIIGYLRSSNEAPPLALLFWRAFCDLGLAIRFLANDGFNLMVCGHEMCTVSNGNEHMCYLASGMMEFFEVSSEAWFLCIGLDLYFSITRSFSSFKSRLFYYHLFSWSFAIIYAIPAFVDRSIYGFWYVDTDISADVICWLKIHTNRAVSYTPYVMFYIPLVCIYVACIIILISAYHRLKRGISRTMLHRMKFLITNSINISVLLSYWFVVGIFYCGAYSVATVGNIDGSRFMYQVFLYMIASKGFFSIIVWITVHNINLKNSDTGQMPEEDSNEETVDFNTALRQEILHYATTGIRKSAQYAVTLKEGQNQVTLRLIQATTAQTKTNEIITAWFFLRLVVGNQQQITSMNEMARESTKKPPRSNKFQQLNSNGEDDVTAAMRLSQRPTVVTGRGLSATSYDERMTDPPHEEEGIAMSDRASNINRASDLVANYLAENDDGCQIDNERSYGLLSVMMRKVYGCVFPAAGASQQVEFTEFAPFHFRRVRIAANISDQQYITAFSNTIKERLTEGGASGAFFFFSKDESFIAKSCTEDELETLKMNSKAYADYLEQNKNSYISRIFGAYRLRIYSTSLYFFVMNNIFLNKDKAVIHEKYDIKGSWVARNAALPREGQSATCTHCEQKFTYHRKKSKVSRVRLQSKSSPMKANDSENLIADTTSPMCQLSKQKSTVGSSDVDSVAFEELSDADRCPYTVKGHHVPSVILKDNDLKYKIRLPPSVAVGLKEQLAKDAQFLLSIGVMDYSLLVGVHNTEYEVNNDSEVMPSAPSSPGLGDSDSDSGKRKVVPLQVKALAQFKSDGVEADATDKSTRLQVSRVVGPAAYYVGIIDYQQQWNLNKKMERFAKINFQGADPDGLSSIEPNQYRDRFVRHVTDLLDLDDNERARNTISMDA